MHTFTAGLSRVPLTFGPVASSQSDLLGLGRSCPVRQGGGWLWRPYALEHTRRAKNPPTSFVDKTSRPRSGLSDFEDSLRMQRKQSLPPRLFAAHPHLRGFANSISGCCANLLICCVAGYQRGPLGIGGRGRKQHRTGLSVLAVWSILYGACLGVQSALGDRMYPSSIARSSFANSGSDTGGR